MASNLETLNKNFPQMDWKTTDLGFYGRGPYYQFWISLEQPPSERWICLFHLSKPEVQIEVGYGFTAEAALLATFQRIKKLIDSAAALEGILKVVYPQALLGSVEAST